MMELPSSHHSAESQETPEDPNQEELEPSKSQRKREADEIRNFARLLTTLPSRKLKNLPLPVEVEDAVKRCPPTSTRGAHKRHLQFIGKLLRKSGVADELMAILNNPEAAAVKRDSTHEEMREKLLTALPDHVDAFRQNYPTADLQQVRQLVRQANAHVETNPDEEPPPKTIAVNKKAAKARSSLLALLKEHASNN